VGKVLRAVLAVGGAAIIGVLAFAVVATWQENRQGKGASKNPEQSRAAAVAKADSLREAADRQRKEKAKADALQYVRVSRTACRELAQKTEAITWKSTVDASSLPRFIPPEIYPTDAFATYVGETVFADVRSQLTQAVDALVDLLRGLSRNSIPAANDMLPPRSPEELIKERTAFQEKKLRALTTADNFCEAVRRAAVGLGELQ
jgi:hypothetical protein